MNHSEILTTLQYLRPSAEFVLRGDDLEWLDTKQDKPTEAEIQAGWTAYQAAQQVEAQTKAAQKAALLNRLGITEDEAKLLLS